MQDYLVTIDEMQYLTRDISRHIDVSRLDIYIREAENLDVRNALGDDLFIAIKQDPGRYSVLLNGGTYETRRGKKIFDGVKTALSYYAYARIIKNADNHVTRFGFVQKDDEYSTKSQSKDKVIVYNDVMDIANRYMKECQKYLIATEEPLYRGAGVKSNVVQYRVIGR